MAALRKNSSERSRRFPGCSAASLSPCRGQSFSEFARRRVVGPARARDCPRGRRLGSRNLTPVFRADFVKLVDNAVASVYSARRCGSGNPARIPLWRYNEAATEAPPYRMKPAELGRTVRRVAYILSCALPIPGCMFAAGTGSQNSPTFSPGFLIAWLVCNGRKRSPIGGWLFFFYWQLYSGLLMTVVFFATNIQSYVPENFASTTQFALFWQVRCRASCCLLSSSLWPQSSSVRTWDMLKLLRWVMVTGTSSRPSQCGDRLSILSDNLALSFDDRSEPAVAGLCLPVNAYSTHFLLTRLGCSRQFHITHPS